MALNECDWQLDTPHIRRLVKETLTTRRTWLNTANIDRIRDVLEKYPHLRSSSLIMYELQLLKNVEEVIICNSIETFLNQLAVYYDTDLTEISKANILLSFHNEVTQKKFVGVNEKLFTVKESGKSTKDLLTAERASPRAVIYTIDGTIASGFIVADGSIKMKICNPTKVCSLNSCCLSSGCVLLLGCELSSRF